MKFYGFYKIRGFHGRDPPKTQISPYSNVKFIENTTQKMTEMCNFKMIFYVFYKFLRRDFQIHRCEFPLQRRLFQFFRRDFPFQRSLFQVFRYDFPFRRRAAGRRAAARRAARKRVLVMN